MSAAREVWSCGGAGKAMTEWKSGKVNHRGTEDTEKRQSRKRVIESGLNSQLRSSRPVTLLGSLCVLCDSVVQVAVFPVQRQTPLRQPPGY